MKMNVSMVFINVLTLTIITGCSKVPYDTYTECALREEQSGASYATTLAFCRKLVAEHKIKCDSYLCESALK